MLFLKVEEKRIGLKSILDYFRISEDEAMAFGDGGNDIEIIEFIKYGVAMKNSGEDVKRAAMYVLIMMEFIQLLPILEL